MVHFNFALLLKLHFYLSILSLLSQSQSKYVSIDGNSNNNKAKSPSYINVAKKKNDYLMVDEEPFFGQFLASNNDRHPSAHIRVPMNQNQK